MKSNQSICNSNNFAMIFGFCVMRTLVRTLYGALRPILCISQSFHVPYATIHTFTHSHIKSRHMCGIIIFIRNIRIELNSLWNFQNAKLCGWPTNTLASELCWCDSAAVSRMNSVRLIWKWKKATGEYVMIITTGISTQSTHSLHLTSTKKKHNTSILFRRRCKPSKK